MRAVILLALLGLAAAVPRNPQRIVGGSVTTIGQYPFAVALLYSSNGVTFFQSCGGTILNSRSVLTAAHCVIGDLAIRWRSRVGSTNSNSGGTVYNSLSLLLHPSYNTWNSDGDIAIIRVIGTISLGNSVAFASIAGPNYNPADNQAVWAIGWGTTSVNGPLSAQLRHVQIWIVNHNTCRNNYASRGIPITNNMLCAGWLGVGGRDQCQGDSGGPLIHNGVVFGVCSFGFGCAEAQFPGVNARVASYSNWIQSTA